MLSSCCALLLQLALIAYDVGQDLFVPWHCFVTCALLPQRFMTTVKLAYSQLHSLHLDWDSALAVGILRC